MLQRRLVTAAPLLLLALAACANPADPDPGAGASAGDSPGAGGDEGGAGAGQAGGAAAEGAGSPIGGGPPMTGTGGSAQGGAGEGGDASGGAPPVEDCDAYPFSASALLAERVGFGAATTGGDPGTIYHVTTLADAGPGSLRAGLETPAPNWIVFDVNGVIVVDPDGIEVESNKTIDGRGRDITIKGWLKLNDVQNVIFSDLKMTNPPPANDECAGDDVVTIRGDGGDDPDGYTSRNFWFNHVEAYEAGDGLIDFRGASLITISWSHFHSHKKAMLAWETDSHTPAPGMRVTYHHNFFDRITLRGPQFVYGWAHFFNNYQFEWYEYGASSLDLAQFYSENNVYQARPGQYCFLDCGDPNACGDNDYLVSKEALVVDWDSHAFGFTKSVGDVALEGANIVVNQPAQVFSPSSLYAYSAEPAGPSLTEAIEQGSGPRTTYCQ